LLCTNTHGQDDSKCTILEDPVKGVVVQDLSEFEIEGCDDLHNIIKIGNDRRTVAATGAN